MDKKISCYPLALLFTNDYNTNSGHMAEINNMASTQTTYCKYCGKEIDSDSRYCRYCGKTQDKSKSFIESLKKLLRGFLKLVLVAAICYGFGLIIYYSIGKDAVEETPLGAWGFILPQFLAYLFYKILSFAYPLNGKKKTILASFLAVLTIAFIGVEVYTALSKTEQEKQEYEPQQSTINRIFLGCSFGDSYSHVEETLKAKKISLQSKITKNGNQQLYITNTRYGKYDVDTIFFTFHKDRMFDVVISINTIEFDDYRSNYTYKSLSDLLQSKYRYKKDLSHRYNNSLKYSDDSTEVTLWHKANIDGYERYSVTLNYYDKTSGYKEERDKGF